MFTKHKLIYLACAIVLSVSFSAPAFAADVNGEINASIDDLRRQYRENHAPQGAQGLELNEA